MLNTQGHIIIINNIRDTINIMEQSIKYINHYFNNINIVVSLDPLNEKFINSLKEDFTLSNALEKDELEFDVVKEYKKKEEIYKKILQYKEKCKTRHKQKLHNISTIRNQLKDKENTDINSKRILSIQHDKLYKDKNVLEKNYNKH